MADPPRSLGLPQTLEFDLASISEAVARIAAFSQALDPALVLLFVSRGHALGPLSKALRAVLPQECRMAGCSSAGELVESGYADGGGLAVVFPAASFACEVVALRNLRHSEVTSWMAGARAARNRLSQRAKGQMLGIVVADGLSRREDVLAAALDAALPRMPIMGGFGGNGMEFSHVAVMIDGEVSEDAAVLCLIATDLNVEELVFAHFAPTNQRGVVTAADPDAHVILELNAEPAAGEYARLAGLEMAHLNPHEFASHPLLMRVGRHHHVRAISGVREDGGLQLLASIDIGAVLTLGRAENLVEGFATALARLPRKPALVLGFDCILRRLALEQAGLTKEVAQLHAHYNIRGFNTYGELYEGMHVNQTFVGVAFMEPEPNGE